MDDRHFDNNTKLPKRKHCEKIVLVLEAEGRGEFRNMETKKNFNIKKTLTKLPTKQSPYFFPQTAGAYVWTLEDESGPFFFRASPSSSPLLQTVVALLSPSPSLSLSLSPPISFCLLPPKIAVILQCLRREQIFLHVDSSFIR